MSYVYDQPVTGKAFVGRELLMRTLREGCERGRSLAIFGGPRMGRTSILFCLASLLKKRLNQFPSKTKLIPVFFDIGAHAADPVATLAKKMWTAITSAVCDASITGRDAPPSFAEPAFAKVGKDVWPLFKESLAKLEKESAGTSAWCRHIWLLDNVELLLARNKDDIITFISHSCNAQYVGAPKSVIATGGRLLREVQQKKKSPLAMLRPLFLSVHLEHDAHKFIQSGLPHLADSKVDEILRLSGRHPYVLSRLLAEIEKNGDNPLEYVAQQARHDLETLFNLMWDELDLNRGLTYRGAYAAPEHALLQLLIDIGAPLDVKSAETQLGLKHLKEFTEMLDYLGLAEKVLKGGEPFIRAHFVLWNQWYTDRIQY